MACYRWSPLLLLLYYVKGPCCGPVGRFAASTSRACDTGIDGGKSKWYLYAQRLLLRQYLLSVARIAEISPQSSRWFLRYEGLWLQSCEISYFWSFTYKLYCKFVIGEATYYLHCKHMKGETSVIILIKFMRGETSLIIRIKFIKGETSLICIKCVIGDPTHPW